MHNYSIEAKPIKISKMASEIDSKNYKPVPTSVEELNTYRIACLHTYREIRDSTPGQDAESAFIRFNALTRYLDATRTYARALFERK